MNIYKKVKNKGITYFIYNKDNCLYIKDRYGDFHIIDLSFNDIYNGERIYLRTYKRKKRFKK